MLCNTQACPVDCQVSDWSDASPCSRTCGGGERKQVRHVIAPAENGGLCPALERTVKCNAQPCPVDCVVGEWTNASACSKHCGGGIQHQRRALETPAQHGGACPSLSRSVACNQHSCPANTCRLSRWENVAGEKCSKSCGGGKRRQQRHVLSGHCPGAKLTRSVPCNVHSCPTDCKVSAWSDIGSCTRQCGGGMQLQRRRVLAPAADGGACPRTVRAVPCNQQPCVEYAAVNAGRDCWSPLTDLGYQGVISLAEAQRRCSHTQGCLGFRVASTTSSSVSTDSSQPLAPSHVWLLSSMSDTGRAEPGQQCFAASFGVMPKQHRAVYRFNAHSLPAAAFAFTFQARAQGQVLLALLSDNKVARSTTQAGLRGFEILLDMPTSSSIRLAGAEKAGNLASVNMASASADGWLSSDQLRPFWVQLREGTLRVGSGSQPGQGSVLMQANVPLLDGLDRLYLGFSGVDQSVAYVYMPPPPALQTRAAPGAAAAHVHPQALSLEDFPLHFRAQAATSAAVGVSLSFFASAAPHSDDAALFRVQVGAAAADTFVMIGDRLIAAEAAPANALSTRGDPVAYWLLVDAKHVLTLGAGVKPSDDVLLRAQLPASLPFPLFVGFAAVAAPNGASASASAAPALAVFGYRAPPHFFQAPGNGAYYTVFSKHTFATDQFTVHFRAAAAAEVYLTLSADNRAQLSQRSATAVEVVLGGWADSASLIRVGQQARDSLTLVKHRPLLRAHTFRAFWLVGQRLRGSGELLVRVGRGDEVGQKELMRALVPAAAVRALGDSFFVGFAGYDAPVNFIYGAVGTLLFFFYLFASHCLIRFQHTCYR